MSQPVFYNGLQMERVRFDLRRGLPICLEIEGDHYFIWASEFFNQSDKILCEVKGEEGSGNLHISGKIPEKMAQYADSLLNIAKETELLPRLIVTEAYDKALKKLVTHISADDLVEADKKNFSLQHISTAPLPTRYSENVTLHTYRVIPGYYEYYALVFGDASGGESGDKSVDIRLHAECFTGDLLGSLKCDCGPQLHKALKHFGDQNSGILIYLRQEGRNIGLLNKMRAYQLQAKGKDTVDANLALGFHVDERDYNASALILKDLGVKSVSMLTNNKSKIDGLKAHGIQVEKRIAHYTETQKHNHNYIQTKQNKIGHLPE